MQDSASQGVRVSLFSRLFASFAGYYGKLHAKGFKISGTPYYLILATRARCEYPTTSKFYTAGSGAGSRQISQEIGVTDLQ